MGVTWPHPRRELINIPSHVGAEKVYRLVWVFRAIGDRLYDDWEWTGQINIIKGKAHVVELVPQSMCNGGGATPKRNQSDCPRSKILKTQSRDL